MKKLLIIFTIFCSISCCTFADQATEKSDVWNSAEQAGNNDGQKAVTNNMFDKTIKMLKERQLTRKQRIEQQRVQPLSPSASEDHLKEFVLISDGDTITHTLTVMIPVFAYTEYGDLITPGYYKLSCKKTSENKYVLQLSQDLKTVYTVSATQTNEDLKQDTINFCNAELTKDEKAIKLIYGNLGLNLVGYVYVK